MSHDERLAARVRAHFARDGGAAEIRMMGALCFMVDGNMCCGVTGPALLVRVGRDAYEAALGEPHTRPMELSGRRMRGFVLVDPPGTESDAGLGRWIAQAEAFVRTLPPKQATA